MPVGTGIVRLLEPLSDFLPLAGGTMTGDINMLTNDILFDKGFLKDIGSGISSGLNLHSTNRLWIDSVGFISLNSTTGNIIIDSTLGYVYLSDAHTKSLETVYGLNNPWLLQDVIQQGYFRDFHHDDSYGYEIGIWSWVADPNVVHYSSNKFELAGYYENNGSHADGDSYHWSTYLAKGKYRFFITYEKGPDRGIMEFTVNSIVEGTTDFYDAIPKYGSCSGVFILQNFGLVELEIRVNSKNAASSDYLVGFSKFELERVA